MKSISLDSSQVAWLEMIRPHNYKARYAQLRNEAGLPPVDSRKIDTFLSGEKEIPFDDATIVFAAHGTTLEQVKRISELKLIPTQSPRIKPHNTVDEFLESCSKALWLSPDSNNTMTEVDDADDVILSLIGSVLENRERLTGGQKQIVYGELLDYLLETRKHSVWEDWMIALSHEQNRQIVESIRRLVDKSFLWFPDARDATGAFCAQRINQMADRDFYNYAFFVRKVNMRINHMRHGNYSKQEKQFSDIINAFSNPDATTDSISKQLFSRLKLMQESCKTPVRKLFGWANDNVRPFWEVLYHDGAVRLTPSRWYFLMCATRLMYDWARWHWYSTDDADKVKACDVYQIISQMANLCRDSAGNEVSTETEDAIAIKCRFMYMASTACRYMAEGTADQIWRGEKTANGFAVMAYDLAKDALDIWAGYINGQKHTNGKVLALEYRLKRNCARLTTFYVRFVLKHRSLFEATEDIPDLTEKLRTAYDDCKKTICSPLGWNMCSNNNGVVVLEDKRALEYEFHLRVWIEFLAQNFKYHSDGQNEDTRIRQAMSHFCRMVLVYAYLFRDCNSDDQVYSRWTEIDDSTIKAAESWLKEYDYYRPPNNHSSLSNWSDCPFDVEELKKTIQKEPPSIIETRFEVVCSIMHEVHANGIVKSAIWDEIEKLTSYKKAVLRSVVGCLPFVSDIWIPAKRALESDRDDSLRVMRGLEKKFIKDYPDVCAQIEHWKQYPFFKFRNNLIWAPGNNSEHVAILFRHYKMYWNKILILKKKEESEK